VNRKEKKKKNWQGRRWRQGSFFCIKKKPSMKETSLTGRKKKMDGKKVRGRREKFTKFGGGVPLKTKTGGRALRAGTFSIKREPKTKKESLGETLGETNKGLTKGGHKR